MTDEEPEFRGNAHINSILEGRTALTSRRMLLSVLMQGSYLIEPSIGAVIITSKWEICLTGVITASGWEICLTGVIITSGWEICLTGVQQPGDTPLISPRTVTEMRVWSNW